MAESEEELNSLLLRVKEESQRASLRLNIAKAKIMASGSITSWQIEREKVKIVRNFFSWAPKITADGDCSHEIRRRFASWKESYDKPRQCAEKQRHHSVDKGPCSQGYGLASGHYDCETWTIKKAECQRIDASKLRCWRRLLKVPWTARRLNQSTLREVIPEYSLEGLMLKLKFQYFDCLM